MSFVIFVLSIYYAYSCADVCGSSIHYYMEYPRDLHTSKGRERGSGREGLGGRDLQSADSSEHTVDQSSLPGEGPLVWWFVWPVFPHVFLC